MPLQPLLNSELTLLRRRVQEVRVTEIMSSKRVSDLISEWEPKVQPTAEDKQEVFTLVYPNGKTAGVAAPRWLVHLLGLRHRAVHICFRTETGLIALQRRSAHLHDWPDALDMAVAGHVPQNQQGHDITYEQGAWKEIEEELGLQFRDASKLIVGGKLIPIGTPYFSYDTIIRNNPPFYNAEARQIYIATLTGEGLSKFHFSDGEASALVFVRPETAWDMLTRENIASGLRYSLPRVLEWIENQPIIKLAEERRGLGL